MLDLYTFQYFTDKLDYKIFGTEIFKLWPADTLFAFGTHCGAHTVLLV